MTDSEALMQQIHHYAEQVASLHRFEQDGDAENAAKWRSFVDQREAAIRAAVEKLFAEQVPA